jgi:hypothetical protein
MAGASAVDAFKERQMLMIIQDQVHLPVSVCQ